SLRPSRRAGEAGPNEQLLTGPVGGSRHEDTRALRWPPADDQELRLRPLKALAREAVEPRFAFVVARLPDDLPISDEEQERGALFRRFCPGGPPVEAEHPVDLGRTRARSDDVDARPAEVC